MRAACQVEPASALHSTRCTGPLGEYANPEIEFESAESSAGRGRASALFTTPLLMGPPSAGAYSSAGQSSPTSTYDVRLFLDQIFSELTTMRPSHLTLLLPTQPGTTPRSGKP